MVMSFENQQVLNFLLEHGAVFTFRTKRRKKLGHDWINDGRGRKKVADVSVRFIRDVKSEFGLEPYVTQSGFKNLYQWMEAIMEMHPKMRIHLGGEIKGFLYRVSLREIK